MNTDSATNAISRKDRVLGGLWGVVVGDALGVPVEFEEHLFNEFAKLC